MRESARAVERGCVFRLACRRRNDDRAHAVVDLGPLRARDDDDLVDAVAFDHETLLAVQCAVGVECGRAAPRNRARCASVPVSRTAGTNSVTVVSSGPGAIARPISSARIPASIMPTP